MPKEDPGDIKIAFKFAFKLRRSLTAKKNIELIGNCLYFPDVHKCFPDTDTLPVCTELFPTHTEVFSGRTELFPWHTDLLLRHATLCLGGQAERLAGWTGRS